MPTQLTWLNIAALAQSKLKRTASSDELFLSISAEHTSKSFTTVVAATVYGVNSLRKVNFITSDQAETNAVK